MQILGAYDFLMYNFLNLRNMKQVKRCFKCNLNFFDVIDKMLDYGHFCHIAKTHRNTFV